MLGVAAALSGCDDVHLFGFANDSNVAATSTCNHYYDCRYNQSRYFSGKMGHHDWHAQWRLLSNLVALRCALSQCAACPRQYCLHSCAGVHSTTISNLIQICFLAHNMHTHCALYSWPSMHSGPSTTPSRAGQRPQKLGTARDTAPAVQAGRASPRSGGERPVVRHHTQPGVPVPVPVPGQGR